MKPYFEDSLVKIYQSDSRDMSELPDESAQCVVTSPPYWGLRKYSGLPDLIWGGKEECQHEFNIATMAIQGNNSMVRGEGETNSGNFAIPKFKGTNMRQRKEVVGQFCSLCGAWKGSFGLEPTPEMYVQHTIEILREIRRVLRKDGVVFWNIGDSYYSQPAGNKSPSGFQQKSKSGLSGALAQFGTIKSLPHHPVLKPKDLCLIPFRVAISAQQDGWWVRSVIIWSKPNPMPESVTDRPTESHEYILMLTKSNDYYCDGEAVREPHINPKFIDAEKYGTLSEHNKFSSKEGNRSVEFGTKWSPKERAYNPSGRNLRSVWTFPTQPYPEAHFAVFPEKLPEICIKAATPEVGCCSKCGKPWVRMMERISKGKSYATGKSSRKRSNGLATAFSGYDDGSSVPEFKTLGWQPTCKCNPDWRNDKVYNTVPSIVLDPFAGSGTTGWVAKKLGRRCVMYELSEAYCKLALERNRQMALRPIQSEDK